RLEVPVALDELHHRRVVRVRVGDFAAARIPRHGDEGDTRTIAEEVDRLEEAGVPVTAALVEGDEERGALEEVRMLLEDVEHALDQRLEEAQLRARGMAVVEAVRLEVGHRGKLALIQV